MFWIKGILWKLFIEQLGSTPYIILIDGEEYVICVVSASSYLYSSWLKDD